MGTNRKEQKGNQLVECLKLYHEYVKHGDQPPETKNQFCISAEWIKTLDPRIKEKIRTETRADMEAKGLIERKKKETDLDKKIAAKKLTPEEKEVDLKAFDQMLENRIQNEIARRIEKAHNYSFNLANYKSAISDSQIAEWTEALKHIQADGATTLENIFKKLSNSKPENIIPYLLKLNPANALEADIAREYVNNLDNALITKHTELNLIKEILKNGAKYPFVSIKDTCDYEKGKSPTQATEEGVFPFVVTAKDRKSAPDYQIDAKAVCIPLISSKGHGSAALNRIHYQEGKFALADLRFAAIPKNPDTELLPKFLYYILDVRREELFCPLMKGTANVAMKMEDALNVRFPLPDIEIQKQVVTQIEKQKAIIEGVDKITNNWQADFSFTQFNKDNWREKSVGNVCSFEYGKTLKEVDRIDGKFPVVGAGNIIGYHNDFYLKSPVISTGRRGATTGSIQWIEKNCFVIDTAFYIEVLNEKEVDKRFLFYVLKNLNLQKIQSGGAMPGINRNDAYKEIFLLPDIETQRQIVSELDSQMQILEGLRKMKADAEKKIGKILADLWGVEFVEPVKEEGADEQED